ncbi:MAG: phosphodiesterase [Christensenellales bacterium]|jgi:putative phosphoesterase|nr:phosphodiesterase [Clostridiales bacterium]
MKYLIATDIHGSIRWFNELMKAYEREKPDLLVLLGDYYYHGPRNPFPSEYSPIDVANKIIELGGKVILVKGNCDSEVDEMVTERDFISEYIVESNGKRVLFTHGHKISAYNPTPIAYDAVINGHYHINDVSEVGVSKYITIASISLPKDGHPGSYGVLEKGIVTIKSLDGKDLKKVIL